MIASLVAIALTALASFLYFTRFSGHSISVTSLGLFHVYGLSYRSPLRTITVGKFDFRLKRPSRLDPSWAIITIASYEYKDSACHVSMAYCLTKLWFFPVFNRFSFGPWIDTTIEGFAVHVYDSRNTPFLLQQTRSHLVSSTLNGETVRIGHMGTKFFFGRNVEVPASYASESDGEDDQEKWDTQESQSQSRRQGQRQEQAKSQERQEKPSDVAEKSGRRKSESERDDVRVRVALEQWQMVTLNRRMYTFGEIQGELRRSWLDDRGSVVVIMKNVSWIKLPYTDYPLGRGRGRLWEIARAMWYFPSDLFTLARDPVALVDIHIERFDVTFCDFRLRDAELLKQGATRLKQEHSALEKRHPGVIGDFAWDMFVHGVHSLCKE